MPDRNVWRIWEVPDRDVSDASRFGNVMAPVFDKRTSPHDVRMQTQIIEREVLPFSTADDLVLTVGPQVMVAVLAALLMRQHGTVRFLVWNSSKRQYVEKFLERPARV